MRVGKIRKNKCETFGSYAHFALTARMGVAEPKLSLPELDALFAELQPVVDLIEPYTSSHVPRP